MSQEYNKVIAGLARVCAKFPYYVAAINAVRLHDVTEFPEDSIHRQEVKTAGISPDYKFYFNPEWIKKHNLSTDQCAGLALHELEHNLRGHHQRMLQFMEFQPIIPEVWNIACDLEINQDVKKTFPLPPEGVHHDDPKFGFPAQLLAEEYYRLLENKIEQNGGMSGRMMQDLLDKGLMDKLIDSGDVNKSGETGMVDANVRKQVEAEREQHMKERGTEAGGYKSKLFVEEKRFNWKKFVKKKLNHQRAKIAGRADYSYAQLSKLSMSNLGIVYPKWHDYKPENLYVVLDTSGSMGNIINSCYGYLQNLLSTMREFKVTLIEVDTEIYVHNDLKRVPNMSSGGGGTDLTVAFHWILEQKDPNAMIFCLTDMGTPWLNDPRLNKRTLVLTDDPTAWGSESCPYEVIKVEM